ncbi:MAG: hypothetical protein ACR2HF_06235 [Methylococcaceae bacterium]
MKFAFRTESFGDATELEVRYATDAAANGWGDQCYATMECFEELSRLCAMTFHGRMGNGTHQNRQEQC